MQEAQAPSEERDSEAALLMLLLLSSAGLALVSAGLCPKDGPVIVKNL